MKISFTGAQSTGKTTLLNLCKDEYPDFTYVDEITRRIKRDKGVEINNTAGDYDDTQIEIIKDHIHNVNIECNNTLILDRCIYDGFVYTKYLNEQGLVSDEVFNLAHCAYKQYKSAYDIIFYTDPDDVKLVDDGVRSTDIDFRNRIIEIYNEFGVEFDLNVIKISGTVEQRWNKINKFLDNRIRLVSF